jgi:hypothetical protein
MKKQQKTNAKKLIRDIVAYLNTGPLEDTNRLWWILTALRGPDNDLVPHSLSDHSDFNLPTKSLKSLTTARIRKIIGINPGCVSSMLTRQGAAINDGIPSIDEVLTSYRNTVGAHFFGHFANALRALRELGFIKEDK